MLTISGIARRYKITNLQVQDLIKHGYLPVTRIDRSNKGIIYLFAEEDVDSIDIYSLLADIRQRKHYKTGCCRIFTTIIVPIFRVCSYAPVPVAKDVIITRR
jgi:hypothetical protein